MTDKEAWAIRSETAADHEAIARLTAEAFAGMSYSDGSESAIIAGLRGMGDLVLSLVAVEGKHLVGHVAFSPATIGGAAGWFALGPISVAPDRWRRGIARAMVATGLDALRARGGRGVVLLGDAAVYTRLGFVTDGALSWRGVDPAHLLALPFTCGMPKGEVRFAPAFG